MHWRQLLALCLILPAVVVSTELKPWFDPPYMIVWRNLYSAQTYNRIDIGDERLTIHGLNHLLNSSLVMAVRDDYSGEVELAVSQSKVRKFSFESGKVTGRLHLQNDIVGDPLSVIAGISLGGPMRDSLYDYNLLYHGLFECEVHLSIGRETSWMARWLTRWWAAVTAGIADRGSPWLRARVAWERNFCNVQRLELFADGYGGFGRHDLDPRSFRGYGGIQYRGLDLGLSYHYFTECYGVFSLGYLFRPYAHNLPMCIQQGTLGWRYDFPL